MPFCPKCKYEYEDHIKLCPDCGSELVDELVIETYFTNPVYYDDNLEYLEKLKTFLNEHDIKNVSINHDTELNTYSICTDSSSKYKATTLLNMLFKEELELEADNDSTDNDSINNTSSDTVLSDNIKKSGKQYKSVEYKYNNYLGTGILNTIIGIICDIGLIIEIFSNKYFSFGNIIAIAGMGIVVNLFLVSGILYLIKAKNIKPEIEKEKQLTKEILDYSKIFFTKDYIDEQINNADENNIYFERVKLISNEIKNKFENTDKNIILSDSYLDNLIESIYEDIFESV